MLLSLLWLCLPFQGGPVAKGALPKGTKKNAGRIVAVGGPLGWTFFMSQMWRPPAVFVGDRLQFAGKGHSVWQFKTKAAFDACSFKNAVELKPRALEKPFTTLPFTKPGIYYYGCNVMSHCIASGQKLAVRVLPGACSPPSAFCPSCDSIFVAHSCACRCPVQQKVAGSLPVWPGNDNPHTFHVL